MKIVIKFWILIFILIILGLLIYPYQQTIITKWYDLKQTVDIAPNTYNFTIDTLRLLFPSQADEQQTSTTDTTAIEAIVVKDSQSIVNLEHSRSTLTISKIGVKGQIVDGPSSQNMNRGFWHFPGTVLPGQKGNIAVIGHRYLHIPPNPFTFYNLDKLKRGDSIIVKSKQGSWEYLVFESKVVAKTDTTVLDDFGDFRLTLITCHPLWSSDKRLVIVAKLKYRQNII